MMIRPTIESLERKKRFKTSCVGLSAFTLSAIDSIFSDFLHGVEFFFVHFFVLLYFNFTRGSTNTYMMSVINIPKTVKTARNMLYPITNGMSPAFKAL